MTRRIRTVLASTVLAAGIGLGALSATPALAWGQVSISIAPGSAEQDRILRTGLGIYALVNGIQNGAITQNGTEVQIATAYNWGSSSEARISSSRWAIFPAISSSRCNWVVRSCTWMGESGLPWRISRS